ncbi:phosphomannose isomerase type I family protein, putative [Babesia bigemina]|uniref:mannose-6-phosphate isomerase n=1 Tax=Babesia bigemina TaxID=5866 RepID=A0A061DA72_BABBI|nr:phosphomannose isomerase type I family protein, putative [Babesia bigemina]CDR97438.1 phosphomannose isomerase type I family protein, putative [Babesia bigemina]|eukprot:XP_012769624.1 phosphomannose isomerase type I family protein, putative [Babesia bigemina]
MEHSSQCIYRIKPVVRNYDWGAPARSSLVYRLYSHVAGLPSTPPADEAGNTPYAELWVGDHDSAPCIVIDLKTRVPCASRVQEATDGPEHGSTGSPSTSSTKGVTQGFTPSNGQGERLSAVYKRMGMQLFGQENNGVPILLKVLSIAKPLSLQIHPDPDTALKMFAQKHPSIVDCQAKPEMSVALSTFRAMCGLRPLSEIIRYAERYPPFASMIGTDVLECMRQAKPAEVGAIYAKLCRRLLLEQGEINVIEELVKLVKERTDHDISEQVMITLNDQYGKDICVSFAFVLNCVEIQRGEAFFIPPNVLHSYISGNCLELMNNSDNVIRCGLTSKATDTKAVMELVEVEVRRGDAFPQHVNTVTPEKTSPYVTIYRPLHPLCKFAVWLFEVPPKTHVSHSFNNGTRPFLCIIVETNDEVNVSYGLAEKGKDEVATASAEEQVPTGLGDAFFLYPNVALNVKNNGDSHFVMYLGTET